MSVTEVDTGPRVVARSAVVHASAAELFALVADPHRHRELDGSGTVGSTVKGPSRLTQGGTFSVNMKQHGVPYRIRSTVTELRDDAVVEWRHPMGHRWRWEFAVASPDSTLVTESFDYSHVSRLKAAVLDAFTTPAKNGRGIEQTLTRLQARYPD